MKAVILAGGKGSRLRPYTLSLPKPLMPVGDRPILEIVLHQLKQAGICRVIIAVGYLESLIRAYFGNGKDFGIEIIYSSERVPLGTAGPLRLIESELDETFVFMNGDVLSDIAFASLIESHKKTGRAATVALTRRAVNIDFGVIKIGSKNQFKEWQEKPTFEYLVSTGIYVFEPKVLQYIPDGFYNVPDLIVALNNSNEENVGVYVHLGYWLDVGRLEDYQMACQAAEKGELDFV